MVGLRKLEEKLLEKTGLNSITAEDMMVLEVNSEYLGVSTFQLMECAGKAVADQIVKETEKLGISKEEGVTFFVGTGRNGGDGMVAARHLASLGFKVWVVLVGVEEKIVDPNVKLNWETLKKLKSIQVKVASDSSLIPKIETPIVVDALLGTGVKGKLREPILQAVKIINKVKGFKVSIDLPTGIDASTGELLGETVKADLTITFHKPKTGLIKAKNYAGKIVVASIGIPVEAETYTGPGDVKKIWKPRPPQTHKGDFGRLLIVGGSKTYTGAPAFAALAAYKVGVDLVWVAAPTQTAYTIATYSPEIITIKLEGENFNTNNLNQLKPYIERATTLLVGPGLGTEKETFEAFWLLIGEAEKQGVPVVLDADGLKAYSQQKRKLGTSLILTPHQAEFTMLTGEKLPEFLEDKTEKVKIAAKKLGCVLLVKGWIDLISDGEKVKLNQTGNPGMTVGGTGDILAGILAGLIAQKINPFDAACAAAFLNGAAGDLAYKKKGYSLTPTNLLEEIPTLLQNPMKHKEIMDSLIFLTKSSF